VKIRSATDPKLAHTRVDGQLATLIDAKLADLPTGWSALPPGIDLSTLTCPGFRPNEADLTETGSHSTAFVTGSATDRTSLQLLTSTSTVFATAQQAKSYFTREAKLDRLKCLSNTSGTETLKSFGRIPFPKLGHASIAFRIAVSNRTSSPIST
jgi:hypothetical protein